MTQAVEEILEFPGVVALLRRSVSSPLGAAELDRIRTLADRSQAETALAEVAEAMAYLRSVEGKPAFGFHGLHDLRPAAARLRIENATLEPMEIFRLLQLLERAGDIRSVLGSSVRFPRLCAITEAVADFRPLLRDLAGKILPNGELDDHASVALRRIRREIEQQRRAVHESLERFVRAHSDEGTLQEDYVTIRNERLVVPVKAGQKRRIEGVIHAASSTGHTLFVEPLETIELNNRLVRLAEQEQAEIQRILRDMTQRLAHYTEAIPAAIDTLARLEDLFARARFGLEFDCTVPRFSPPESPRLHLAQARHPLLEDVLRRRGSAAVPASLTLDREQRVLVLSGPNTGGKTVTLKTVGLLAFMAQAGLPVPAAEAEFPWFEQVLADIGDYQSIQDSLSTFSAHIAAIREMIDRATAGSLVLIDEMGAATDPQEGGALGVAVVDHFRQAGAFTLVSTHLPALKMYAVNTPGVLSGSMGFNEETLEPNYRLSVGLPGKSAGLDIARRLGIPSRVIERAQQVLTSQDLEAASLIRELHRRTEEHRAAQRALEEQREHLARREKEIAHEWEKRETVKLKEMERRLDAALEKFHVQAQETIAKIAEAPGGRKQAAEAARRTARLERETRADFLTTVLETKDDARRGAVARPPQPAEGDTVRLRGIAVPARVRRTLASGKLEVEAGFIKMQVDPDEVIEVLSGTQAAPRPLPDRVTVHTAGRLDASIREINVIGATAEEAREQVDKFLDTAVLASAERVRVIHGHGMGVLRKALWQMFAAHPHVAKYYQAEQLEGGAGATIVELKTE